MLTDTTATSIVLCCIQQNLSYPKRKERIGGVKQKKAISIAYNSISLSDDNFLLTSVLEIGLCVALHVCVYRLVKSTYVHFDLCL